VSGPDAPAGFEPHFRRSPLTDPWEPLYSRRREGAVVLGLWAGEAHVNSRGFVHGGLIMALIDNAMGLSCAAAIGGDASLVTASLTVNFTGVAQVGQWLTFETTERRVGGTLAFTQGGVLADGAPCAQASAVFRRVARPAPGEVGRAA
jgi:uncharacterized protein (TIGR00369 family)